MGGVQSASQGPQSSSQYFVGDRVRWKSPHGVQLDGVITRVDGVWYYFRQDAGVAGTKKAQSL